MHGIVRKLFDLLRRFRQKVFAQCCFYRAYFSVPEVYRLTVSNAISAFCGTAVYRVKKEAIGAEETSRKDTDRN